MVKLLMDLKKSDGPNLVQDKLSGLIAVYNSVLASQLKEIF
jgi:hypothetical protein